MDNLPLVSIGIPNFNYAHFITNALESVVNQTYTNIELIIVDDVSTDNSIEVIEDWIGRNIGIIKIKFIKNRVNVGLTKACNVILQNAEGKYFQTLDADDLLCSDKIQNQVNLLEASNKSAWIYSNISVIDETGEIIHPDYLGRIGYNKDDMPIGNIHSQLFDFNFIPLPSVLINTAYAKSVGGFDENVQVQDYYMWLKLSEQFETLYMPGITAMYRAHQSSMSNSTITSARSIESVLKIKYRYYSTSDKIIREKIKKDIYFSAAYLYEFDYPSARHWLKLNLLLNPSIKSFMYFIAKCVGVPYSFIDRLKAKIAER